MPRKQLTALVAASLLTLALLCAGTASAAIPAGNTGWTWSNPQPQGNTLDSLEAAGGRAWAGGATGTLLHSDDGGSNWVAVRTGLLDDIRTIEAISPSSVVFAGRCALRRSDDGGATVRRLPWGSNDDTCTAQIQAVSFPSPLIGYLLLTNGDVYATGDGGDSWKKQSVAPGAAAGEAVRDIFFTSNTTGVLSIGTHIFQSVDAGGSWTPVKNASNGSGLYNFQFASSSIGYAAGLGSDLLKTIDGGTTWNAVVGDGTGNAVDLREMTCASDMICLSALSGTGSNGYVERTTDGGATWVKTRTGDSEIKSVVFVSATRAIAVGVDGSTVVSDDAGASNWAPVNSVANGKYHGLRADSATSATVFGETGAIGRSTDGGKTWRTSEAPTLATLVDATYVGSKLGYALDNAGRLFRTPDDGSAWSPIGTGTTARVQALFAWKGGRLALIGPKGVRISTKKGISSKPVAGPISKLALNSVDAAGNKLIFAYGASSIAVSKDRGATWKVLRRPVGSGKIVRLDMVDAKYGYLLDSNAELFATKNGGLRWKRVDTTGANLAVSMAFGDRKHGYLTDNTGRVLATADGGATWSRQYPFYDSNATSFSLVAAPAGLSALTLVEGTNRIFGTTTGGRIGSSSLLTIKPSATKARLNAVVRVTGKLSPATGTERVVVLARVKNAKGGTRWTPKEVTVSATGTFTTAWKIQATTDFIARWSGDAAHDGDAAPLVVVKLRK